MRISDAPLTVHELLDLERRLTSGPFGDSVGIRAQADLWYQRAGLPPGSCTGGDLHPWAEYLAEEAVSDGRAGAPHLRTSPLLRRLTTHGSESHPAGFLREVGERLGSPFVFPSTAGDVAAVQRAVDAVLADCPTLGIDALGHLRLLAVVNDDRLVGVTWTDMVGLAIIGRPILVDVWTASDSLFHEALHSKMATIERGLTEPFLDEPETRARIFIPWRRSDGADASWSTFRAFDAYYVYAHLTVLWSARLLRARDGRTPGLSPGDAVSRLQRVSFRAEFLSNQLRFSGYAHLDHDRASIAAWLDGSRVPAFNLSPSGRAILGQPMLATPPVPA